MVSSRVISVSSIQVMRTGRVLIPYNLWKLGDSQVNIGCRMGACVESRLIPWRRDRGDEAKDTMAADALEGREIATSLRSTFPSLEEKSKAITNVPCPMSHVREGAGVWVGLSRSPLSLASPWKSHSL